jgi:hypothetical protein
VKNRKKSLRNAEKTPSALDISLDFRYKDEGLSASCGNLRRYGITTPEFQARGSASPFHTASTKK